MIKEIKFITIPIMAFLLSFPVFSESSFKDTIMDFNNEVIDFTETGLMDNIRSGEIVQLSPLDLKVGSIFIDVDGIAKKVSSIEGSGDEVIINTVQPELREVFEFYNIPPQTINLTIDDHLVPESVADSSCVAESRAVSGSLNFEKVIGDEDKVSVGLAGNAALTVGVSCGACLPYTKIDTHGTWKPWKWSTRHYQGYAKGDAVYDINLTGTLTVTAKMSKEIDIPILALSTGPGIDAGVGLASNSSIEGTVTLTDTLSVNINGNVGASCGLDGLSVVCWPVNIRSYGSSNFTVKNELGLAAEVELKEKIYIGVWIKVLGFAIIEADVGGGPYLDFNAEIKGWIQYSTATNPRLTTGWSYSGSGEIGVFAEINASVLNGAWGGTVWEQKYPIFTISGSGGSRAGSVVTEENPYYLPSGYDL